MSVDEELEARGIARHHTGALSALRWAVTRRPRPWPRWVDSEPGPTPPPRVTEGLRYSVVNHSSVLIQTDGLNLLTDPIWSQRCSPLSWAGPKRVRAPGLTVGQLPPIDAVLLSHNHYDHFDLPTLARLWQRDRPRFVAPLGDGPTLSRRGITRVEELRWWQRTTVGEKPALPVVFVPARHFSGRGATDRNRSLWGGFVIETGNGPVYYCGDSGYGPHFEEIGRRLGPMRLSFLPIGAYLPRWFMGPVHLDPAEAVRAHRDVGSRRSTGIHFGTFRLTDEGIDDPERELMAAREDAGLVSEDFEVPVFGAESWLPD